MAERERKVVDGKAEVEEIIGTHPSESTCPMMDAITCVGSRVWGIATYLKVGKERHKGSLEQRMITLTVTQ